MDVQTRPQHRRNASSKSNILKSLVNPKSRPASPESSPTNAKRDYRKQTVPLQMRDYSNETTRGVLGERQGNVQSPPSSPSKKSTMSRGGKHMKEQQSPQKSKESKELPKKAKSSTNLAGVFARMNRSSKDLSTQVQKAGKDKENTSPTVQTSGTPDTPIWAQFSSQQASNTSRPPTRDSKSSNNLQDEINKYTPQAYSPSKQRNFNGTFDEPGAQPTLGKSRPQSAHVASTEGFLGTIGRKFSNRSGDSAEGARKSEDVKRRDMPTQTGRVSMERSRIQQQNNVDRKASGSSTEQPAKEKLNVTKRGRVMAAVAAFQGKAKEVPAEPKKEDPPLDPKAVDAAFEAVLESRNVPEAMRQKMRAVTLRVKADFIKTNQGADASSIGSAGTNGVGMEKSKSSHKLTETAPDGKDDDDSKSTKRSRTRSRTFTFSKGDKKNKSESPSKKNRSHSKSRRPLSIEIPDEGGVKSQGATPSTPTGSFGRKSAPPAIPKDYIDYLRKNQDPTKVEVGRLHKLRILLRNETVAWVDAFISLDGMSEIVGLLHRTMEIEWREDHEDQLLHETLLCLKGLCTTERALAELEKVADSLFPALLGMLFDDEKKGPAEYTTRTIIINVLCKLDPTENWSLDANKRQSPSSPL